MKVKAVINSAKGKAMNNEKSVELLNTIIEINNDRVAGYERAVEETEEPGLGNLFSECAETSKKCRQELIVEVQRLGGAPTRNTKVAGDVFRAWMSIKTELTAHHNKPILNSCVLGEEAALEVYDNALNNHLDDLTDEQQTLLNNQRVLLRYEYDKLKSQRDMIVT